MKPARFTTAPSLLLAAALISCIAVAAAQRAHAAPPPLSQADEKAIKDLLKDQESAWNKHDMHAFTKSLRDDAEGINVAGMYWKGKAAIVEHLVAFHATFLKDCGEWIEEVQIHPIGEGYAVAVSIWKVDGFKGPGGEMIPACRHRDTSVLVKEADGWKVVHFHNVTIDEAKAKAAAPPAK